MSESKPGVIPDEEWHSAWRSNRAPDQEPNASEQSAAETSALQALSRLGDGGATSNHEQIQNVLEQLGLAHLTSSDVNAVLQATKLVIRNKNGSNQNS